MDNFKSRNTVDSQIVEFKHEDGQENKVRSYPVTKIENIFLICNKCGVNMKFHHCNPDITNPEFIYICPNCNHIQTSKQGYPFQRVTLDMDHSNTMFESEVEEETAYKNN